MSNIENIAESRVKITADIEQKAWKEAQEKAFDKVASKVTVKGFRPGKAPKAMLKEKVNPTDVWNEAIEMIVPETFQNVVIEHQIRPAFRPEVNVTKLSDTELTVEFVVILVPTVELGAYKDLKIAKEAPAVTDEEVDEKIKTALAQNADLVVVDREAKMGDTVVLDFTGYTANEKGELVAFDGGAAQNFSLELGSHQFIPGFEEAVVGLKTGEKKDIKVTFPTNYVKELAGKEATFKLTIHEIKEKEIPTLTDDSVKELGIKDVETVEALKSHYKEQILKSKIDEASRKHYEAIIEKIAANSKFVIDEAILHSEAHRQMDNLKKNVEAQGMTLEQYLDITGDNQESLEKKFMDGAKKSFERFLIEQKVIEVEKLSVTDEELETEIKNLAAQYGMKEEEIKDIVMKNKDTWTSSILERKVREHLSK